MFWLLDRLCFRWIRCVQSHRLLNYDIEIISQCREIHREICTHQNESISITVEKESNQDKKIPDWVKNVFVWYAQDKVTEEELLSAIEFLVNQNIIQIQTNSK